MTTQIEKLDGGIKRKDTVILEITGNTDFEIAVVANGTFRHRANHLSIWSLILSNKERSSLLTLLDDIGLNVKCTVQESKTEMTKDYPTFSPFLCDECQTCPLYWSLFIPKNQPEIFLKGTSPCYIVREDEESVEALLKLSDKYRNHYDLCTYLHK